MRRLLLLLLISGLAMLAGLAIFGGNDRAIALLLSTRTVATGALLLVLALLATALLVRALDSLVRAPLKPWHTHVPPEPTAAEIELMDWSHWLAAEDRLFEDVRQQVALRLAPEDQVAENRFWPESPLYPPGFAQDFNRSYRLLPEGEPKSVVVLLHGLTDSPYSLRQLGQMAAAAGHAVLALRVPGHGAVPAGLARAQRRQWKAATRLVMREAQHLAAGRPVSIIGYSMGAALALHYSFEALADPALKPPARLILLSPMIGITDFARLAGLAALPALIPAFSRAAWVSVNPEFNPFKFNSFPANAAVQGHRLTRDLQRRIRRAAKDGTLASLPPVLAFQSVIDATVSTPAVVDQFMNRLAPAPGETPHELVLFDINRASNVGPLKRASAEQALAELTGGGPRAYRTTIVANASPGTPDTVLRTLEPGVGEAVETPLGLPYPRNIFSLSHIALPFPMDDSLYGIEPDEAHAAEFGTNLGSLAVRGELGVLSVDLDQFARLTCNPFFPWLARRAMEALPAESRP
jgi:alpha-beta hydrolase superfamily lysophospholipase